MGALLGALSSLCVGGSEFFGRRSSLVTGVLAVAVVAQGVACLASLATVAIVPSAFDPGDLLLGAASGVGIGFGMVLYLGGVLRSSATVVAPLVAVLTVVIPVGYASVVDEAPSVLVVGGVGVAVLGLVLITSGVRAVGGRRSGLLWGTGAGMAYGLGLSVLMETDGASGSWPGSAQRFVAAIITVALALSARKAVTPQRGTRLWAICSGVLGAAATLTYIWAVQADPLPAAVTGAMFPAVSVALGRVVFGDEVRRSQGFGLLLTLVGVGGVVAG